MYSLILVVATGIVTPVGTYSTLAECRIDAIQFRDTKSVTAACVQKQDPKVQIEQAQRLMLDLMQGFQAQ